MNASKVRPSQWLQTAPEEAVMYEEQVRTLLGGTRDRAFAQIDRRGHLDDVGVVLDLYTVQGLGVVREPVRAQKRVELVGNLRQGGHGELTGDGICVWTTVDNVAECM